MRRSGQSLLVVALALAGAPTADAADFSLIGNWEIVAAAAAPWTPENSRAALANEGKRRVKSVVTFGAKDVKSTNKTFICKRVVYEPTTLEPDALFQGNMPEPNPARAASAMGFAKGDVPGIDVRCVKAQFSYHFLDRNTAMLALDNIIYTFKRQ